MSRPDARVIHGDCLTVLPGLPENSVHCAVTSPPYWGLRAYPGAEPTVYGGNPLCSHEWVRHDAPKQHHGMTRGMRGLNGRVQVPTAMQSGQFCAYCGAWRGLLGMEPSIDHWIRNLVLVFRAVRRVLRHDGTFWLNVGEKWNCTVNGRRNDDPRRGLVDDRGFASDNILGVETSLGLKQAMLLPERLALALQHDGWIVRSRITWEKPDAKPDHRKDIPGSSTETVWLLAKSERYFYDAYGEREACSTAAGESRHLRDVWRIGTEPGYKGHSAAFPVALPRRCIRLGTSEGGCCARCGSPLRRTMRDLAPGRRSTAAEQECWNVVSGRPGKRGSTCPPYSIGRERPREFVGWQPGCRCNAETIPCTVLDPFSGTATAGVAALEAGRAYIGIELSERYAEQSRRRLSHVVPSLDGVALALHPAREQRVLGGMEEAS